MAAPSSAADSNQITPDIGASTPNSPSATLDSTTPDLSPGSDTPGINALEVPDLSDDKSSAVPIPQRLIVKNVTSDGSTIPGHETVGRACSKESGNLSSGYYNACLDLGYAESPIFDSLHDQSTLYKAESKCQDQAAKCSTTKLQYDRILGALNEGRGFLPPELLGLDTPDVFFNQLRGASYGSCAYASMCVDAAIIPPIGTTYAFPRSQYIQEIDEATRSAIIAKARTN